MYNELYEAWKKEKENMEIQVLPKDFYTRIAEYMEKIRKESRMLDEKTTKARLMERELKNARKMVKELVQLRYKKLRRKTMTEKVVSRDALTKEEEKLHSELMPLAESYEKLLKNMLRGKASRVKEKEKPKQMLVRFLQEVPAIIGSDMKSYGPFKAEDVATLPTENARILISQGAAVEVEAK